MGRPYLNPFYLTGQISEWNMILKYLVYPIVEMFFSQSDMFFYVCKSIQ